MVAFKHILPVGALLFSATWNVAGVPLPRDDLVPHIEITDEIDNWHTLPNVERNEYLEPQDEEVYGEEENKFLNPRAHNGKSSPLSDTSRDVPIALVDDKTSELLKKGQESKDDRTNQKESSQRETEEQRRQREKKEKEQKEKEQREKEQSKRPASDSSSDSGSADVPIALVDNKVTETILKTGDEAKHHRPNTRDLAEEGSEAFSMASRSISEY